jgi:type IV pilus assembly protein PilW
MRAAGLKPSHRCAARQVGVTLVELMVALLIGSLLIVGAVTVYMQSRNSYRTTDSSARLQETGRYVFNLVEPDVRGAGFWGMHNHADDVTNAALPAEPQEGVDVGVGNNCGNNWVTDVTHFLDGREDGIYGLACPATNPDGDSDVLIVRRASVAVAAPVAGRLQIQSNRVAGRIFSDGAIPAGFAAAPASLTHDLVVNAYYVSNMPPGADGLQQFELRRQSLVAGPAVQDAAVIQGVQNLQVQFGIDGNGDGNADRYANPPIVNPAVTRVVSARIWLLLVSDQREVGFVDDRTYTLGSTVLGPFNDDRRRLVMSKTIQIRNSQP